MNVCACMGPGASEASDSQSAASALPPLRPDGLHGRLELRPGGLLGSESTTPAVQPTRRGLIPGVGWLVAVEPCPHVHELLLGRQLLGDQAPVDPRCSRQSVSSARTRLVIGGVGRALKTAHQPGYFVSERLNSMLQGSTLHHG